MIRLLLLIILITAFVFTAYYVGANDGYAVGYLSGANELLVKDILNGNVTCRYVIYE